MLAMLYTEYVTGPVPVEVDASDARRGDSFDVVDRGETKNRTSDTSPVAGRRFKPISSYRNIYI